MVVLGARCWQETPRLCHVLKIARLDRDAPCEEAVPAGTDLVTVLIKSVFNVYIYIYIFFFFPWCNACNICGTVAANTYRVEGRTILS